ncbi:restriction endonuclease [Candidatus Bathyarchaeota archaeon]|nr:restriction endonuclease [Candidatus Bathyarchaeota archaeon]
MTMTGEGLEERIARVAEKYGWEVELRKKHGKRIQDLVLTRRGIVLVIQVKDLSSPASPRDVAQTRKDADEYVRYLLEEVLGVMIVPVLVSRGISEKAMRKARSYGVRHYTPEELEELLK